MNRHGRLNRREFHAGAGSILLGGALVAKFAHASDEDGAVDFQRSFMTWDFPFRPDPRPHARHNIPHGNLARIQLDAIVDVIDGDKGTSDRFVLIVPCRSEWVYADDHLFQLPNREYCNIYSLTEQRAMECHLTYTGPPSRGTAVSNDFRSLKIDVCTHGKTRRLDTSADIVAATAANVPLIARTCLEDPQAATRYVLHYPIKTMNFQPKTSSFQVDTGPLLVPDFSSSAERAIDRLELAHIAYNRLDRAEFIIRRPTPVTDADGKTLCQVLHYSESVEHSARTEMFAGEN